jgi:hypothetical protein
MTAVTTPVASAAPIATVDRRSVLALARTETRRNLRSPVFLMVLAVSAYAAIGFSTSASADSYPGETYSYLPLYFGALTLGTFVLGLRSGGRDHRVDAPPLAEECALDETARTTGRLLGLAVFPALAAVGVLVIAVVSAIEGGYWIGESRRTDTALHTPFELLQPIVLVALAGAAGTAAGRRFRHRTPIAVLGAVIAFLTWAAWWMFQWAPMFVVSLVQTQPIEQPIAGTDVSSVPDHWLLHYDTYETGWFRQYVDQPLIGGHVLYLMGLTVLCVAAALRVRDGAAVTQPTLLRRRLRWIGWASVAAGILIQLWATGFALTPHGTGDGQIP